MQKLLIALVEHYKRWCFSLVFILLSFGVKAQEGLTLQEASARALRHSPELQVFQWRSQAIQARAHTANLRPPLELSVEAENIFGSGEMSSLGSAEYTLALSSIIELGGKRRSRLALANSRYALAELERQAQALDLLSRVTQRFVLALALSEKLKVAIEATEFAEKARLAVYQRVERGAEPEAELLRAEAALAQATLRKTSIEAEFAARKLSMAVLWGADNSDFDQLLGDLYDFPPTQPFDALFLRASESPAIEIFTTEARVRDAERELSRSQSSSNLHWSLGIKQFAESDDSALTAGLSLPLSSVSRNRGEVQAARAESQSQAFEQQAAELALRARLFDAWQSHKQSTHAAKQLKEKILPALEKALSLSQEAYEKGRYRYTDLVSAQRDLLDARLALIDAASTAHLNQALIEQLTAVPLTSFKLQNANAQAFNK